MLDTVSGMGQARSSIQNVLNSLDSGESRNPVGENLLLSKSTFPYLLRRYKISDEMIFHLYNFDKVVEYD
jgi:hypothetical protein